MVQGPNGTRLPVLDSRHQPKDNSTPFGEASGKYSGLNHNDVQPSPQMRTPQKMGGGSIQNDGLHVHIQQDMLGGTTSGLERSHALASAKKRNSSNNFETQPTPQRTNHHRNDLPKGGIGSGLHDIQSQNEANTYQQQQQRAFRNQSETANMIRVAVPGASKLGGT